MKFVKKKLECFCTKSFLQIIFLLIEYKVDLRKER